MNLYSILELEPSASADEIKSAYRRLVFLYHPDKNPDPSAKEKFLLIEEAYTILSNKRKRARYDRRSQRHSNYSTTTRQPRKSNYEEWLKYQNLRKRSDKSNSEDKQTTDFFEGKTGSKVFNYINVISFLATLIFCALFTMSNKDGRLILIAWMMFIPIFVIIRTILMSSFRK